MDEKQIHFAANEETRKNGTEPRDGWGGSPGKPEHADRYHDTSNNHRRHTAFGDEGTIGGMAVVAEVNLVVDYDADGSSKDATDNGEKREIFQTGRPSAILPKRNWISLIKQKEHTIDKGLIQGQKGKDRLGGEKP